MARCFLVRQIGKSPHWKLHVSRIQTPRCTPGPNANFTISTVNPLKTNLVRGRAGLVLKCGDACPPFPSLETLRSSKYVNRSLEATGFVSTITGKSHIFHHSIHPISKTEAEDNQSPYLLWLTFASLLSPLTSP